MESKGGRTRTDKIGVGAGADIGGTDILCNLYGQAYTGPTGQSYEGDPLDKYAGLVRRAGVHSSSK